MRNLWHRTKGKIQIYWRLGRKDVPLVFAGLTAVLAVLLERHDGLKLPFFVAILGLVWTTLDWLRLKQKSKKYQLVKGVEQAWRSFRLSSRYDGWEPYHNGLYGTAWSNPKLNQILSECSTPLEIRSSTSRVGRMLGQPRNFKLPPGVREFERYILLGQERDSIIFNEKKIRIAIDLSEESITHGPVIIERTTYFDSLCTNDLTEWALQLRDAPSVPNALLGVDVVSNNHILRDLSERMLSNHVGGSTLAFTLDDYLVIQRQTKNNVQSAGRAAPSGSGSLRWKDTKSASTVQDFVKTGLERELVEETGVSKNSRAHVSLEILGAVRHAHRGGQVEFYGIARLPIQWNEVRTKGGEHLYVFDRRPLKCPLDNPVELAEEISRWYMEELPVNGPISFPLEVSVMMLLDALKERPWVVGRALGVEWNTQRQEEALS
jgi:hypothetical protein